MQIYIERKKYIRILIFFDNLYQYFYLEAFVFSLNEVIFDINKHT